MYSFLALVSEEDLAVQICHEDGFRLIWILVKWIFLGKSTPTEKKLGLKRLFCCGWFLYLGKECIWGQERGARTSKCKNQALFWVIVLLWEGLFSEKRLASSPLNNLSRFMVPLSRAEPCILPEPGLMPSVGGRQGWHGRGSIPALWCTEEVQERSIWELTQSCRGTSPCPAGFLPPALLWWPLTCDASPGSPGNWVRTSGHVDLFQSELLRAFQTSILEGGMVLPVETVV